MADKLLLQGTIFYLEYNHDGIIEKGNFILAEIHENDFIFQVISMDGYHNGSIEGLILKVENSTDVRGITLKDLKKQLKERIFGEYSKFRMILSRSVAFEC